jgi:NRAMP (natural resistance-associated macrophage protein)-like metal ion transporter
MDLLDRAVPHFTKGKKSQSTVVRILKSFGPGIITGAADDDPSGIATYSQTGAQYGFGQLWTAIFMLPMMYVVQEMAARIAVVTGKGIAKNIRLYYSRWLLYPMVLLLVIANVINLGTDLGAMAASTRLFIPLDFKLLTVLFAFIVLTLEIFIPYKRYAKVLKYLTISLFAYVITVFFIHTNWLTVIQATIIPNFQFNFSYLFIIVGVLGTTISPYMMFWQANEEVEEEKEHRVITNQSPTPNISTHYLNKTKSDTFFGMLYSEIVTWCIIVTTAATLHKVGFTNIQSAAQVADALQPLVHSFPYSGEIAKFLFAIGVIGVGLLAVPIFAGSASYAITEIFNWKEGLGYKFKSARAFYIIILIATIVGLSINFLGINPIQALVYTAVLNGFIAVPLIGVLLLITNNKGIMGNRTNGWLTNVIGVATFIIMGLAALGTAITFIHL